MVVRVVEVTDVMVMVTEVVVNGGCETSDCDRRRGSE